MEILQDYHPNGLIQSFFRPKSNLLAESLRLRAVVRHRLIGTSFLSILVTSGYHFGNSKIYNSSFVDQRLP